MTTVTSPAARARDGATPAFAQLCKTLYGGAIDPDEVWDDVMKLAPDQADVNAQGASRTRRTLEGVALGSTVAGGALGIKEGLSSGRGLVAARRLGQSIPRKKVLGLGTALLATGGDAITTAVLAKKPTPAPQQGVVKALMPTGHRLDDDVVKAWPNLDAIATGIRATTNKVTRSMLPVTPAANPVTTAARDARSAKVAGRAPMAAKTPSGVAPPAAAAGPAAGGPSTGTTGRQQVRAARAAGRPTSPGDAVNRALGQDKARAAGKDIGTALGTRTGQALAGGGALALGSGLYRAGSGGQANAAYMPDVYSKGDDIIFKGTFAEVDEDQRTAFGWASVTELNGSPVIDKQGDFITTEDIEKAAYQYVHKSRVGGDMHRRTPSMQGDSAFKVSDLIESIVFTDEKIAKMGLPEDYPRGWWVGFKIHDEPTWQMVKKGLRTGFSIHGKGMRRMIDMDEAMGYR